MKILANRVFLLVKCVGEYEDYREIVLCASENFDLIQKEKITQEQVLKSSSVIWDAIKEFDRIWYEANGRYSYTNLIPKNKFPNRKELVTQEMKNERAEIDKKNALIVAKNRELQEVYWKRREAERLNFVKCEFPEIIDHKEFLGNEPSYYAFEASFRIDEVPLLITAKETKMSEQTLIRTTEQLMSIFRPPRNSDWDYKAYLKSLHTKQLMNLRKEAFQYGHDVVFINEQRDMPLTVEEINEELNTREHVPNKQEAKAIRQQAAKEKRNR